MNKYTVYGAFASGERVMDTFETHDQAVAAIHRYMNRYPSAVFYINDTALEVLA